MSRRAWATVVAVPLVLSAACAGGTGDLNASAAKVLQPAVQDVRDAAATETYGDLRRAVQHLKDLVQQEQDNGDLSSQRAVAIENAADVLLQDARPTSSPSPTTTSESPTPTPTTTSESPTPSPTPTSASPTPTSASPTPSESKSPIVQVSGRAQKPRKAESPSPTPSSSR